MDSIRIAIVEDEADATKQLTEYMERYARESGEKFIITTFSTAATAIAGYKNNFDVVFMDVMLPDGNGIDIAKRIREKDKDVVVVFVTNMAQFAVRGYEVQALDYVVKPVSYYNFTKKLAAALDAFRAKQDAFIWISNKEGKTRLNVSSIVYVEVFQHILIYHTTKGDFKASGSLSSALAELKGQPFSLCNRCYLVNLRYVTAVKGLTATVNGQPLQISNRSRGSFMKDLNDYLAGGGTVDDSGV